MKLIKRVLFSSILLCSTLIAVAGGPDTAVKPPSAFTMGKGFYFGFRSGLEDLGGDTNDVYDSGFNAGAQIGYKFLSHWQFETTFDFYRNDLNVPSTIGQHINMSSVFANVLYGVDLGRRWTLFAGAGAGWFSQWGVRPDSSSTVVEDNAENQFGYQGTVGVGVYLTENVELKVDYRIVAWTDSYGFYQNVAELGFNFYP
jgi:opacity protein-like surface antigen